MRIVIASDHAAYDVKRALAEYLRSKGHQVDDLGAPSARPCDYPPYAEKAARQVAQGAADTGVILCGNGIGMSIAANKVKGVRASLCYNEKVAVQTRQHNASNMLVLPGREYDYEACRRILDAYLGASATTEERHVRRVNEIKEIEERFCK